MFFSKRGHIPPNPRISSICSPSVCIQANVSGRRPHLSVRQQNSLAIALSLSLSLSLSLLLLLFPFLFLLSFFFSFLLPLFDLHLLLVLCSFPSHSLFLPGLGSDQVCWSRILTSMTLSWTLSPGLAHACMLTSACRLTRSTSSFLMSLP